MAKHTLVLAAALAIAAPRIEAAPTVRAMYNDAFAREHSVRAALEADGAPQSTGDVVRDVIARYEAVVRRYPASSYSDNALWQAARLALDSFTKFGQPQDKETAARLLRRLAAMYPTSRLAAQVPNALAKIDVPATAAAAQAPAFEPA